MMDTGFSPEHFSPAGIENGIRDCVNRIASMVQEVSEREASAQEARRKFDWDWAHAMLAAEGGNAEARKAHAVIATMTERAKAEVSEQAFHASQRRARALDKELDAWRSLGVSVRSMYGSAGVGDR